ncbi:MAG: helix-turn-helix transcriptional regulator [Pseudomonadota bacterium]
MSGLDSEWHEGLAVALAALETPRFAPALVGALGKVAPFDHSVIFAYRGEERPIDLFDNFGPARRGIFVTDYQAGPYLLDPFYHASRDRVPAGLYRMRELAPDRFYQSEYYRSYYAKTGLAEEIGFFLAPSEDVTVVISLMRAGHHSAFAQREMRRLKTVAPVVVAASARNWRSLGDCRPMSEATLPEGQELATLFNAVGQRRLTRRECEVGALVLRGHSSEAIARQLKIAPGTVKIHRKNIYAKLGIASQAELFSLFLSSLAGRDRL